MNIFLRNTISKFHDAVSTALAAMSNYLAMRQKSDCDAAFLLYQITKAKLLWTYTERHHRKRSNGRRDRRLKNIQETKLVSASGA